MKAAIKDKLVGTGWSAANASVRAEALTAGLHQESFDCVHLAGAPEDKGVCSWHPYLQRVNVLPDRVELVWYDGDPSADAQIVRLMAPPSAVAQMCNGPSAYKGQKGPLPIKGSNF